MSFVLAGTSGIYGTREANRRGIMVYNYTQTMALSGKGKDGQRLTAEYDRPLYGLSLEDRVDIFRTCSPVFGVVSGRMNKVSAYKWRVTSDSQIEERKVEYLKGLKDIYDEFSASEDIKYQTVKAQASQEIRKVLSDCLPDLSNFNASLMRWYRRTQHFKHRSATEIEDWLKNPNSEDTWADFIKKWIFDYHIHGSASIYKEELNGRVENLYVLPGGSVVPLKSRYIGGYRAFAQMAEGLDIQIYFGDEISYAQYLPCTSTAYGLVPLDALTNKIAESLMFDKLMAEQADGTKPPEKMVVFGASSPFGDAGADYKTALPAEEQQKIETMMNEARKGAIRTLTGYGQPLVLDLSRENTMSMQNERQKAIREEVALVFGATNMEVNLTGADDTSGRSTSDAQETIEFNKGMLPILARFQDMMNTEIIPFRFGDGWNFEFMAGKNEMEEYKLYQIMLQTGLHSVNEIRTKNLNEQPFKGAEFDKPAAPQGAQPPDGSQDNPMNVQGMGGQ